MPKINKVEKLSEDIGKSLLSAFSVEEDIRREIISHNCRKYPEVDPDNMDRQERYDLYGHC